MTPGKSIILVLVAGFFISLGTNLGLLYLRRDAWLPAPETAEVVENPAGETRESWNLRVSHLQDLAQELKEKEARLVEETNALVMVRARIDSEREDLDRLRQDLEEQLAEVEQVFTRFAAEEQRNIKSLSRIYAEMAPEAVCILFREIDEALAVKILSELPQENAGGILETMAELGGEEAHRAARLTSGMRTLVTESGE